MPRRCSSIIAGWHIERQQLPTFYAELFQWHCDRPPEPTPPPAVVDDKLDLPGCGTHDLSDKTDRRGVEVEYRQTDEIVDSYRLRKALQIAFIHWHWMLCVHHAGPRHHGLRQFERGCRPAELRRGLRLSWGADQ